MLYKTLMAGLLILVPSSLNAQSLSPAVRNAAIDRDKFVIEFDILNIASKAVHSWLLAVNLKAKNPAGDISPVAVTLTSESCSRSSSDLAPLESRRCSAILQLSGPDTANIEAAIQISAVQYEDGTADGDLQLLDSVIHERQIRLQTLRYWQERFQETFKAQSAAAQLKMFIAMLFSADPAIPADIQYDSTAMREQALLRAQLSATLEALRNQPSDAPGSVSRLVQMFEQRIQEAAEQCRTFPAPPKPYSDPQEKASHAVENLTSGFRVVRAEEERDGTFRLVLRNYYEKEIVEYALTQRQSDGVVLTSRNLRGAVIGQGILPGTAVEIRCDALADSDPPIEISCVIFRDGTSEGDQELVRSLNESWSGRLTEMKRVLPRLRAIFDMPDEETTTAIDNLIADLSALDQSDISIEDPMHFTIGIRQQRLAFSRELQGIAQLNPSASKMELGNLIRRVETKLGRN